MSTGQNQSGYEAGLADVLGGRCEPRTISALMARGHAIDFYAGPGEWHRIKRITPRVEGQPFDARRTYVICTDGTAYRIWADKTVPCRIVRTK